LLAASVTANRAIPPTTGPRSIGVGAVGEAPVVVLPGPPVACLLGAVLFCRPALGWLVDSDLPPVHTTAARLAR
jgi:molybdopterin molybdotransferase